MLKQIVSLCILVLLAANINVAQDKTNENKGCSKDCCTDHNTKHQMSMMDMKPDSTHKGHLIMKSKSDSDSDNSIIRKGEIDLKSIDKNQDGKVYQDQMCWNVISDKPGECPQCGMILKEVSLDKAKENLLKHDYKVK